MNSVSRRPMQPPTGHGQRGVALVIVVVLLLLASIMSLYAVRVGLFEQSASANDVRARYTQQLADSAIAEGIEFVRQQGADFTRFDAMHWTQCGADETTFPCGALPEDRRATMYAYQVAGAGSVLDRRMLPYDRLLDQVGGGFDTEYGAGIAICWVSRTSETGVDCATDAADASNVYLLTVVGLASIPGETARATAVQTLGSYALFSDLEVPPVLASGSVRLRGGVQIVTNPNSAGTGVPVSVWTRDVMDVNGTPETCYAAEFFRSDAPSFYPDSSFVVCDRCSCSNNALSYSGSGNKQCPGIDILAGGYSNTAGCPEMNDPVDAQDPAEFPCDLFRHVFGVRAWRDASAPPDNFCETKVYVEDPDDEGAQIDADIAFLNQAATPLETCDGLGPTSSGLTWVQEDNCNVPGRDIGSPDQPVLLVLDSSGGNVQINSNQTRIFGVVFIRDSSCDNQAPDCTTSTTDGGAASLRFTGGQVYGAVIIQGQMPTGAGSGTVVYSEEIIQRLREMGFQATYNSIPGSWTDRVRY